MNGGVEDPQHAHENRGERGEGQGSGHEPSEEERAAVRINWVGRSRESGDDRTVSNGRLVRRMVDAALSPVTAHTFWGDLLIAQTDGQIWAFDAFTGTPTLSILTSRAGNEAA